MGEPGLDGARGECVEPPAEPVEQRALVAFHQALCLQGAQGPGHLAPAAAQLVGDLRDTEPGGVRAVGGGQRVQQLHIAAQAGGERAGFGLGFEPLAVSNHGCPPADCTHRNVHCAP